MTAKQRQRKQLRVAALQHLQAAVRALASGKSYSTMHARLSTERALARLTELESK